MLCLGPKKSLLVLRLECMGQGMPQCSNDKSRVWYHSAIIPLSLVLIFLIFQIFVCQTKLKYSLGRKCTQQTVVGFENSFNHRFTVFYKYRRKTIKFDLKWRLEREKDNVIWNWTSKRYSIKWLICFGV